MGQKYLSWLKPGGILFKTGVFCDLTLNMSVISEEKEL
jgi:hypothetical protein